MLVYILLASSIIYALALGYISFKLNDISNKNARELTSTYAREYANYTAKDLSVDMNMAKALAQMSMGYEKIDRNDWDDTYKEMLLHLLEENPNFLSTWYNWQLDAIWPEWEKDHGRKRMTYYRLGGQIKYKEEILDTVPGFTRGAYYTQLEEKAEDVMDPYYFSYQAGEEEFLETSVVAPIMNGNEAVGVAGFDLLLDRFQELVVQIHPIEGSYAFMIAYNGQFVAHNNEEMVGQFMQGEAEEQTERLSKIQTGEEFFYSEEKNGKEYWIAHAPVYIGNAPTPWSFAFAVPIDVIMAEEKATLRRSILVGLAGLILIAIIIWFIAHSIAHPITRTTKILSNLAEGDIDESRKLKIKTGDEIGEMGRSVNTLIDGLNKTAVFAQEIGKGNLEKEFDLLSDKDILGKSLLDMRESLKEAKKQERNRKIEDQKQNWATQGLAKFGEILRQNNDDMKEFAYHIISNLVKYIEGNQGGLFIINDDEKEDKFIELLACYAYERRKYIDKRVDIGVGLIGRCVQEQKTIYMTELPEDYISITSGLGQATPDALLIVPLKVNEEIFGVLELATFGEFEPHVIKFVEEVGESIASTISTTKINIRTNQLLEKFRQQSEEMAAQEEEMRQNMEELQATQEEAARRSNEMQGLLDALNKANLVIEYDLEGKIISANDNYLQLVGISREQIIGTHHTDNMDLSEKELEENTLFWRDLRNGESKRVTSSVTFNEKTYTFVETYTPILDENGNPEKVLKISTDITEFAKRK